MDTIDKQDDGQYPLYVRSQTVERTDKWSFDGEAVLTAGDGVGVGKVFHYANGKFGYHQRVYKFSDFRDVLARFFFLYLKATLRFEVMRGTAKATVDSLRLPMLRNFPISLPPYVEQAAIIRFLDHAGERIQRYISAKKKLIALLEEQRHNTIQEAITGTINVQTGRRHRAYRSPPVEWLNEIPEHWTTKRLKHVASIRRGQVDPRLPEHREKTLIAPNHIPNGGGQISQGETADEQGADSGKYEICAGDVVYSKIRPHLRKATIAEFDGLCSADMYGITMNEEELAPSFFLHLLLSDAVTRYTVDCSMRVAMPKINREALGNCWLAYPPVAEQRAIVRWIKETTRDLEAGIETTRRNLSLVEEFRTRLISDVVGGKLDVREEATNSTVGGM